MGRKLGTSGRIIKRKHLKPAQPLTDEQLLRSAQKQAEKWLQQRNKGVLHSN